MTKSFHRLLGIALCASLAPAAPSAEVTRNSPAPNQVREIAVGDVAGGVELEIRGTRAPSYTVFKLQDPARLVVDLAGADVSAVAAPVAVGKGGVREVTTAQYKDDRSAVGRIVIALDGAPRYEVAARGEAVVVKVTQGEAKAKAPAEHATATPAVTAAPAAPARVAVEAAAPVRGGDANVVSRRVDEAEGSTSATAVTGARTRASGILLALDGEIARFEVIELSGPPRLAVDLHGVTRAPRAHVALQGAFK
jgi:type IV pilus assembly protein PilQ